MELPRLTYSPERIREILPSNSNRLRRPPIGGGRRSYVTYDMRQGPVSDILGSVLVALMYASAAFASPCSVCKDEVFLDPPAIVAGPAAGEEAVHFDDLLPICGSEVFEDADELAVAEVAHFPTPTSSSYRQDSDPPPLPHRAVGTRRGQF